MIALLLAVLIGACLLLSYTIYNGAALIQSALLRLVEEQGYLRQIVEREACTSPEGTPGPLTRNIRNAIAGEP